VPTNLPGFLIDYPFRLFQSTTTTVHAATCFRRIILMIVLRHQKPLQMISTKQSIKRPGKWSLLFLFTLLFFASCKKDTASSSDDNNNNSNNNNNNNNGQHQTPQPTPEGTPVGAPMQVTIGVNGGAFTTPDGRLSLEFPSGAITAATTFTIQPVTNHCPASTGNAFRITPHITFTKPVKLSFAYGDSDIVNTIPMALTIAYQDEKGIWQAPGKMIKDTLNKKVTVLTNHFSGWSLFRAIELTPYTSVVEPGGEVQLVVDRYVDFKNDSLLPLEVPLTKKEDFVKEWKLAGEGILTPKGNIAVYKAPGAIPTRNPVAVSATLNTSGTTQFILVSNIYIGKEGLTFRIDKGPWMHGPSTGAYFNGYYYQLSAANTYTPGHDGVTITWTGETHIIDFVPWRQTWPSFVYGPDQITIYNQLLSPNGRPSPGGIYFHQAIKTPATPYVIGAFYLEPAQRTIVKDIPEYTQHRIEGFFKVKWQ
jgi:hypothetical protein